MGLKATDFQLTDSQLAEINRYIAESAAAYAAAREGLWKASWGQHLSTCVSHVWLS